jgi:heterodisulfide reductase subunit A
VAENGRLSVHGVNTLSGEPVEVAADLVVLASACVPAEASALAGVLRVPADAFGFFQEAHPKLRPVETLTAGIFLAGTAQAPKDIPSTVAQASAAAGKAIGLLAQSVLQREPTTAVVRAESCVACFECLEACAYQAIERREVRDREGALLKLVAWSNPAVCEGCGVCVVTCRGGNIDLHGSTNEQLFAQLDALAHRRGEADRWVPR